MKRSNELNAIDIAAVQSRMLTIRNQQVLLDRDVAALYGVPIEVTPSGIVMLSRLLQ